MVRHGKTLPTNTAHLHKHTHKHHDTWVQAPVRAHTHTHQHTRRNTSIESVEMLTWLHMCLAKRPGSWAKFSRLARPRRCWDYGGVWRTSFRNRNLERRSSLIRAIPYLLSSCRWFQVAPSTSWLPAIVSCMCFLDSSSNWGLKQNRPTKKTVGRFLCSWAANAKESYFDAVQLKMQRLHMTMQGHRHKEAFEGTFHHAQLSPNFEFSPNPSAKAHTRHIDSVGMKHTARRCLPCRLHLHVISGWRHVKLSIMPKQVPPTESEAANNMLAAELLGWPSLGPVGSWWSPGWEVVYWNHTGNQDQGMNAEAGTEHSANWRTRIAWQLRNEIHQDRYSCTWLYTLTPNGKPCPQSLSLHCIPLSRTRSEVTQYISSIQII